MAIARPDLDLTPPPATGLLRQASQIAARMPYLVMEARRVSANVSQGLHGRRRPGPGEAFWQFRHFQSGEPASRVDWRRSARDHHLYVREKEWEAAHTVQVHLDRSQSMLFGSGLAPQRKIERAIVLALATLDLMVRGGERVAIAGVTRITGRPDAAERAAEALAHAPLAEDDLPEPTLFRPLSDAVLISDFLSPIDDIEARLRAMGAGRVRGHLLEVLDPAEETFPFSGRTEFQDPETGQTYLAGRAQELREAYRERLQARRQRLRQLSKTLGWSHLVHHTDRPAQEALLALQARLTAASTGLSR
ncbi:DUF58 domain-containing protein [Lutibaculum baratangense]|uniref:Putative conserved membrane protein n=1 Tax=Lutibaculum baratangense AMV1 TaxID=631454 RepID=V4T9F4_9HYPH|nr:DUF58 domain-containing protein [Lutibaculum baratangense]ESR23158.1 putative conserved membrane protein [Lutibaculum baratangense AMV1]